MELGNIKRTELYHSGKANNVYLTNKPEYLELEASDRISAGNGEKKDVISGKGIANNTISKAIFTRLENSGIHTHYIGSGSNEASKIVKKAEPILLEVIGRFKATGSYIRRHPEVKDMTPFDGVFIEYTLKSDELGDPPISREEIIREEILTTQELSYIDEVTEQVAYVIKDFFAQCNGELIDFKIEFGRLPIGSIIVIDEISPDTCRILDSKTGKSLDKDRFRKDMGEVAEAYTEMAKRVSSIK